MNNWVIEMHKIEENNKLDENNMETEKEPEMVKKKKTDFKKTDIFEVLLELYKIATAECRAVGLMKVQLASSALFGMAILLTFSMFVYYLAKDGFLGDVSIITFVVFLALMVLGLFLVFGAYFLFLNRVQRTQGTTAAVIEKLLREVVSGEKNEDDLRNEILDKFPYLRVADKMNLKDSRWLKHTMKWQGEDIF